MNFLQQLAAGVASDSMNALSNMFSADKPNYTVTESKLQDYQKYVS